MKHRGAVRGVAGMTSGVARRVLVPAVAGSLGGLVALAAPAHAEGAFSGGIHVTLSFGADGVRPGVGLDIRGALLLEDSGGGCANLARSGVGLYAQFTWLTEEAIRFSAGVHGGSEVDTVSSLARPAWDLELGWTYRNAFDGHRAGHGLQLGVLGAFETVLELSARTTLTFAERAIPELTIGSGVRFPGPFGSSGGICVEGRPLRIDGRIVLPAVALAGRCERRRLKVDAAVQRALADAWLDDARAEAASVPAFQRLGHDLARLDAAPELVERSRRAARDEVRHARQCADLAAGYRGVVATPLALPCPTGPAAGWAEVVSDSWRDGCLGEGAAARRAERARVGARDELVRAVQGAIAVDEANHAELAWSVMAEGLRRGGPAVRDGLAAELDRAAAPPAGMHAIDDEAARAHGRLSPRDAELAWIETHERGLPRARALLDAASAAAGRRS